MKDRDIIDLKPEPADEGEIRYTRATPPSRKQGPSALMKVVGIALGVALFLLLLTFFVYVVIPVALLIILFVILRNIFKPRKF